MERIQGRHVPPFAFMERQMSWRKEDNKNYRGKIDRVFVSMTEPWEVEHFVDTYLTTRGADLNDANRGVILNAMEDYPGKAPVLREDLVKFLNTRITIK